MSEDILTTRLNAIEKRRKRDKARARAKFLANEANIAGLLMLAFSFGGFVVWAIQLAN